VGRETVPGQATPATRKVYVNNATLTRARDNRPHQFATGTRDNLRAFTLGPVQAGGSLQVPVSADELIEWLLITVQGAVTPTTPPAATNARLWTFKPSNTVDTATIERNDGANLQRGVGYRGNQITIAGSVAGDNAATIDLFGQDVTQNWGGPLATLTDRVPTFMEGWQTRLWLDPFGTTPGATLIPNALINWQIRFNGNLGRKYTANNTLAASAVTLGMLAIDGNMTFEASAAQAITELVNWDGVTQRVARLEFLGPAGGIEAGANEVQSLATTGVPTGGTFTLNVFGAVTGAIAFNATAAAVQAALEAAATVGTGNVVAAGGPLPTAITLTFQGALAQQDLPSITIGTNTLTGGTTPVPTISTTTPGRSGARYVTIDIPLAWQTPDPNQNDAGTRAYQFPYTYVFDPTNLAAGIQFRLQNARTVAFA
jgi:hypothetical protein